jgi:site-specific recombinase XerC
LPDPSRLDWINSAGLDSNLERGLKDVVKASGLVEDANFAYGYSTYLWSTEGAEMNRQRAQQQSGPDLVDEFWNLQNHKQPPEMNEFADGPLGAPAEIELAVITEALSRARQQLGSTEFGRFLALNYSLMQNSRITFQEFAKTRFIPEHVTSKGPAGRTHYHAILKHILKPETVDALFDVGAGITTRRLTAITDWPYLDDVRLCDLKPDHVRSIISAALDRGYSVQTVKHIRNVIGTIITHATKRRCFNGDNPAFQVPLPTMIRKAEANLTLTQTKQLLGVMRYPEREIALIAIFTGLNMLEILGLQWKHVNLTESPLNIDGNIIRPRTIAVKKQWNHGELDNVRGSRMRNVEISEPLLSLFRDHNQRQVYVEPNDFVLVSRTGTALCPGNILKDRLKPLGRELGMPWLSWHMFSKAHKALLSELKMELIYHPKLSRQDAKAAHAYLYELPDSTPAKHSSRWDRLSDRALACKRGKESKPSDRIERGVV